MKKEQVTLIIPSKPEYISTVRLTTSSIASKIGLDIEKIEDLRVAISEACNIILGNDDLKIVYEVQENCLDIIVGNNGSLYYTEITNTDLAKQILETLVDDVEFSDEYIKISITGEKND